jgi:2-succinyl-6-hydroxy-2,4-cyclohexadiene-1-carboxylate synthase
MTDILTLGNYQFHYKIQGSRDRPVILFLHGFLGDCHEFDAVISHFSDRFCCLSFDLPGHGLTEVSGGDRDYTMPNTAQAIILLLQELQISRCRLVGYSMGGRLALYLALHFPHYFTQLVLESASPGLKTPEAQAQRAESDRRLAAELETTDLSTFLTRWYNQPLFASFRLHPEFEQICERRSHHHPAAIAQSLRHLSTGCQPSLWSHLSQNQLPLLLLVGEQDPKFTTINAEMATTCPTAQLRIIPGCGHNIHIENPQKFAQALGQFFSDRDFR